MSKENEMQAIRSVALQNSNSILVARQRAEDALVIANESLEQKTVELALTLSMMRATLEATNDAILVTNAHREITDFNEQFVDLWGLSRSLMDSKEHSQVLEQASSQSIDREAFLSRINEIYASSEEASDELLLRDGRVIERTSRIQFVDGDPVGRVWSFRDISERKRFQETRFRLAAVVDSSNDAIISKTLDGIITSWNSGAERMFGYPAAEAVGQSIMMLIPPERASEEKMILASLRRGERVDNYETERLRKDRSLIVVSLAVAPLMDSNGQVIGASKIARDITQRKVVEENLRQLAEERRSLLDAERAARSEAERLNVMKDEFLATLSHELRTPLSAILGWSQLLGMDHSNVADLETGLDAIQRNARAQTQLIEDLLDMSRIASGKVRLDVQSLDLTSVVDAAVDAARPAADAKSIRLRKILDPKAGPVSGDPTRLQQVVWNLLSNAIKFTPKGGHVDVLLERVNSHLEITVHDSGIGIEPEFIPLVFERFRQADSSSTRTFGGLGLGLAIVKSLVELHGGTVTVRSDGAGLGTTFTVKLPLAPIRGERGREHPTTPMPIQLNCQQIDLTGIKVLVVDDEPDSGALVRRVLTQYKAEVTLAESARSALAQMQDSVPDVIVSDIGMPDMDGYQFIRELRKLSPTQGGKTPAVALTAFARSEDRTRAMLAGYQVHISKPIEPQELIATVGSLTDRMNSVTQSPPAM